MDEDVWTEVMKTVLFHSCFASVSGVKLNPADRFAVIGAELSRIGETLALVRRSASVLQLEKTSLGFRDLEEPWKRCSCGQRSTGSIP